MRPAARTKVLTTLGLAGLLGLALAGLGAALGPGSQVSDLERVDRAAPPLAGRTVSGAQFDLRSRRGSVVLVNVWASWCPPCREELPLLDRTRRRLSGRGLVLVGVLTRDQPDRATALLQELGIAPFPTVPDPTGRTAVSWGATGVPETYLVDREGRVVARSVGPVTEDWVTRHVDPVVGS